MGPRTLTESLDDAAARQATGARSFQVLFDASNGSTRATLFAGFVPPGKAPWHYHLYDEIVWVPEGPGRLHVGPAVEELETGLGVPAAPARGAHRREHEPGPGADDHRALHARRQPLGRVPHARRRRRVPLLRIGVALSIPATWSDTHRLHAPETAVWVGVSIETVELPARAERIRAALVEVGATWPLVRAALDGLDEAR